MIFVTGKGGAGKSTVSAALALALSRHYPVTFVELDPRPSAGSATAAICDRPAGRNDRNLEFKKLTPRGELEAFVEGIVPLRALSRRMLQSRTFGFVTAALPGLEAFLILDRLRRMSIAAEPNAIIVVDTPATGGALEMLSVAQAVRGLAPFGALHRLADEVEDFLRTPERFAVVLTLRPEELALREAVAAAKALRALGIECAFTILNRVTTALFSAADIAPIDLLPAHRELAQARRAQAESSTRVQRELQCAGLEVVLLPTLYRAKLGCEEFSTLADILQADLIQRWAR